MTTLGDFLRNQDGATAIEYALIASLIAIVIVSAVQLAGTQVSTVFGEVGNALK
jgi:pilus assembly protein Flp/PilA